MKTIKDYNGNKIDFEAAVMQMDDEIREQLHGTGIEDEQELYNAYCEKHYEKYTKNLKSKSKRAQTPVCNGWRRCTDDDTPERKMQYENL